MEISWVHIQDPNMAMFKPHIDLVFLHDFQSPRRNGLDTVAFYAICVKRKGFIF